MKMLIADADPVARRKLEMTLARWGYEVTSVADGDEACRVLIGDNAPPLAVLSWAMPGMDGPDVCRSVRQSPTAMPSYLILLTASRDKEDIVAGLEAGADDCLTRPFESAELRARVMVGARMVKLQRSLVEQAGELDMALLMVKQLQGLLPVCSSCKGVRQDQQYWQQIEHYATYHLSAGFNASLCPSCYEKAVQVGAWTRRPVDGHGKGV
jgi:DNA-binding response OmpR family regulator